MLRILSRYLGHTSTQVPFKDWKIVRGDKVEIITGRDKGKRGTILAVKRKHNTVVVSGANLVLFIQKVKHLKYRDRLDSGKVQKEFPIHVSNVMLIDPETE